MIVRRVVGLLVVLVTYIATGAEVPMRHSYRLTFKQPYFYNGTIPDFDHVGHVLNAMPTSNYIRLAPSIPNMRGAMWNQHPNNHTHWMVEIAFRMTGTGTHGGDGIGFWYTKQRGETGPVLGGVGSWTGLGVLFSSWDAKRQTGPLTLAMVNNGTISYEELANPASKALGACNRSLRNLSSLTFARVWYELDSKLKVELGSYNGEKQMYEPCFESESKVDLPTGYYFGISASTPNHDFPDDHDVMYLETYELLDPTGVSREDKAKVDEDTRKHYDDMDRKVHENTAKSGDAGASQVDFAEFDQHLASTSLLQKALDQLAAISNKLDSMNITASTPSASLLDAFSKETATIKSNMASLADQIEQIRELSSKADQRLNHATTIVDRLYTIVKQLHERMDEQWQQIAKFTQKQHAESSNHTLLLLIGAGQIFLVIGYLVYRKHNAAVIKKFM